MSQQSWLLNISDPTASGFPATRTALDPADNPVFIRNSYDQLAIYPLEYIGLGGQLFKDVDLTDLTEMQVAVGKADQAPTGGTFKLSVFGNSTGLTALAYNISESALETALNANPSMPSGGCTVSKAGNLFIIRMVNANTALTITADVQKLSPPSEAEISTAVTPAAGVIGVYTLEIYQSPYAYSTDWTPRDTSGDGVSVSVVNAGSSSTPGRFKITVAPNPVGGSVRLTYGEAQQTTVSVQANTARKQVWTITPTVGSGLDGKYFDLSDANGPVRPYFDFGSATAPAAPLNSVGTITAVNIVGNTITSSATLTANVAIQFSGTPPAGLSTATNYYPLTTNTTVQVATTPGGSAVDITGGTTGATINVSRTIRILGDISTSTAAEVAVWLSDNLNEDSAFADSVSVDSAGRVVATAATGGARRLASSGTSCFTIENTTPGASGDLQGKAFVLNGPAGTVGVYVTSADGSVPTIAANCASQIAVSTLSGGESASSAATAITAVVDADSRFVATASGNVITVTDAASGERGTDTTASSGYFGVAITKPGQSLSVVFPVTASGDELTALLSGTFTASKTDVYTWQITRDILGACSTPTATDAGLLFPLGVTGTLPFDTLALHQAFANESGDTIAGALEITATFTGDTAPRKWLHIPCTLTRDLLNGTILNVPAWRTADSGTAAVTSGNITTAVTFTSTLGSVPKVICGPVIKAAPSDNDPPMVMAIQSLTTSGFTIKFAGTPTANASVSWVALT